MQEEFIVCAISRDDLKNIGIDSDNLSDSTMQKIASKMGEAYCNNGFLEDLRLFSEMFGVVKIEENAE